MPHPSPTTFARITPALIAEALRNPTLESAWDGCLAGWPDPDDAAAPGDLRAWIGGVRDEFVEAMQDVTDPDDLDMCLATWLIHLKSQWTLMNIRMQYQTMATGVPDMRLMFKGSLLTSFLDAAEPLLTYRDVERIHGFLARPLLQQQEATTVPVEEAKLQALMTSTNALAMARNRLGTLSASLGHALPKAFAGSGALPQLRRGLEALEDQQQRLGGLCIDVQQQLLSLKLVPAAGLLERARAFCEKAAGRLDRRVKISTQGERVLVDTAAADALLEPVALLGRLLLARSLEPAADRKAAGKPKRGQLSVHVLARNSTLDVLLEDDGRPAPPVDSVPESAAEQAPLPPALHALLPDAAERQKLLAALGDLARLGGSLTAAPKPDGGLRIRLRVPVQRSIVELLMVRVGDQPFALPAHAVRELLRVPTGGIESVDGRPVVRVRGELLRVIDAEAVLASGAPGQREGFASLVVLEGDDLTAALRVSAVDQLTEASVQPLEDLAANPLIAGGTPNTDGHVVLVVDVDHLLATAPAPRPRAA